MMEVVGNNSKYGYMAMQYNSLVCRVDSDTVNLRDYHCLAHPITKWVPAKIASWLCTYSCL